MKVPDQPQIVVIYGDKSSCPDAGTVQSLAERGLLCGQESEQRSGQKCKTGFLSEPKSGAFPREAHAEILGRGDSVPGYDPHQVHRDFPERWMNYIRANYRNLAHVQEVFCVSERTARKWWKGHTGANGGHVAIAMNEHPVAAPRMLFAAE